MISIVKSIIATAVVSGLISFILHFLGFDILKTFTISAIVLIIVGFIYGQFIDTYITLNLKRIENERIKEFTKQGLDVECAYCGENNFVPIRLAEKNEFTCTSCAKVNSVYIEVLTTQTTTPLQGNPLHKHTLNQDKQDALDSLK